METCRTSLVSWLSARCSASRSRARLRTAAQAQSLGTFRWQLQPYCNVVSLTVTRAGGVFTLDGFDDQCGAAQRASVVGNAVQNPDGSINLGMVTVLAPSGTPVHVDAHIDLSTLGGTWRDSSGNSGAFVLTPGTGVGGAVRPVVSTALFRRTAFRAVLVGGVHDPPTQLAALTFTPPVAGVAELRGRGFCNLSALATNNTILISAGVSAADALTPYDVSGLGIATVGHGSIPTLYQPHWSTDRVMNVSAGVTYTVGLFAQRASGATSSECSGTFAVQIFPGSLP